MNKIIKLIVPTVLCGSFVFCDVSVAMRENPQARSISEIHITKTETLRDQWGSFHEAKKLEDISRLGMTFAENALKFFKEKGGLADDESIRHEIRFLCNAEVLTLLNEFTESELKQSDDLKKLLAKLCDVISSD